MYYHNISTLDCGRTLKISKLKNPHNRLQNKILLMNVNKWKENSYVYLLSTKVHTIRLVPMIDIKIVFE